MQGKQIGQVTMSNQTWLEPNSTLARQTHDHSIKCIAKSIIQMGINKIFYALDIKNALYIDKSMSARLC